MAESRPAKRKASGEPTDEVPVKQKKHPRLEEATGEDAKTSSASGAVSTSEADPTTGSAGAAASAAGDDTPAGSADGGKTADTADVGATAGSGSGSQAAVEDKEDAEERERVAQLKKALAAALARKQAIEDGKDPELLREVQIYETRQRHAVNTAESYCKWRMDTVKAQLAYEKAAAQQVFENQCKAARASMLESIEARIKEIKDDQSGVVMVTSSRMLRSSGGMGSGSDSRSQTPANMFKPYILSVDPALDPYLSEDAVLDDLRAVHKNWMSQAKKFRKSQQGAATKIKIERGRLMCGDTVFERGDRVIVTSDITGQTFYGSITSLGAIEVGVRLADGTRSRVPMSLLQQGRCALRHE